MPPSPLQRNDKIIAFLLFSFIASFYFSTVSGITSSNDGSHYALIRTMAENHTFALMQFDNYAEGNDVSITEDGTLYSDRPPGTAVIGIIFYTIGGWFPDPSHPIPSRHDAENSRLPYVMLLPALFGAGTVVLLYLFLRQRSISAMAALTTAIFFAIGTIQWKYSSVLFSHALSSFLVMSSLYMAVNSHKSMVLNFMLGLVLGFAVLTEYSNALLVIIIGLFLLADTRPFTAKSLIITITPFVMGGLLPATFLAFYNSVNFGSPLTLSYTYALNYPWAGEFSSTFSFPLLSGLKAMLYSGEGGGWCGGACINQGVFLLSPILLFALPGFWIYFRQAQRVAGLTTLIFIIYLILFSKHHTAHGFTGDGRYLAPFLPLLAIPMGYTIEAIFAYTHRPTLQAIAFLGMYGLFYLSARNIFIHIGYSYNYYLEFASLDRVAVSPANWNTLFNQIFRNIRNLPLLWGILVIMLLQWLIMQEFAKRKSSKN